MSFDAITRCAAVALLLPVCALVRPTPASAQVAGDFVAAAGVGGTYYCIVSRCNSGTTVGVLGAFAPLPFVMLEAAAKRHFCFDCDRYYIAEAGVQLRYPHATIQPFLSAGASRNSDPEFMGEHTGPYAAAGVWIWPWAYWGLHAEVRGRRVMGAGNSMAEVALSVTRRLRDRDG
jgi:hypothetical protein